MALHAESIRALSERRGLIEKRLVMVRQAYVRYAATLPGRSWLYLPPLHAVLQFAPVQEFTYSPSEEPPQLADLDGATSQFPEYIDTWSREQKVRIEEMFPNRFDYPSFPWSDACNMLNLATTVFQCTSCRLIPATTAKIPAIAWRGILAHYVCCYGLWERLSYSYAGSATVAALIRLLGLSALTTLPDQLDELDHRFFCANCPQTPTRAAYTWRECVRHSDLSI